MLGLFILLSGVFPGDRTKSKKQNQEPFPTDFLGVRMIALRDLISFTCVCVAIVTGNLEEPGSFFPIALDVMNYAEVIASIEQSSIASDLE